jgi:hypothetical protein
MAPADESHRGVQRQLREAILTGQLVDLREGDTSADGAARGSQWGARRTVPAVVLVDLLTRGQGPAQPRALRLAGARITGRLDLEAAHLACPILLLDCWFEDPVALSEATVPALRLPGCDLPALDAEQLTTRGDVDLRHGLHAHGDVNLGGAHIGGSLILDGATLSNPDGPALYADRLTVDQAMLCQEGFSAQGAVYLEGAHVGGSLRLKGATLTNDLVRDWGWACRLGRCGWWMGGQRRTARSETKLGERDVGLSGEDKTGEGRTAHGHGGIPLSLARRVR